MTKTLVVAGVGPGLGASIVRRFAEEGFRVGMLSRSSGATDALSDELGVSAVGFQTDLSDPESIKTAFAGVREQLGPVDVLVNHASAASWRGVMAVDPAAFEQAWRVSAMGALLCSREVVPGMLEKGSGCVLFTGATSSIRGCVGAVDFSSAKFAVRGLADAMARELWPQGIHVAHVIVDGGIDARGEEDRLAHPSETQSLLDADAIAKVYWDLYSQHPSSWSWEIDVRPNREPFFE